MKCFTVAIPNLPDPEALPVQAKRTADFLKGLTGLTGVHPHWPDGTILFFDTLENARHAWRAFTAEGNKCGDYIMNAEQAEDGTQVVIKGVAEKIGK